MYHVVLPVFEYECGNSEMANKESLVGVLEEKALRHSFS
jgi:hypothetical protein